MLRSFGFTLAFVASIVFGQTGPVIPDQCTSLFCPLANVPSVTFPAGGGKATSTSTACCVKAFDQCQDQTAKPTCRRVLEYEIPAQSANSAAVCQYSPNVPEKCQCQQSYAVTPELALRFCPIQGSCCDECECYGDPHCTAFKNRPSVLWAVCDDRNVQCLHDQERCKESTYLGQPCTWNKDGFCQRPQALDPPTMVMYSKNYVSSGKTYSFNVKLTLGLYGSITDVWVTDKNVTYHFGFTENGQCTHPLPLEPDNTVELNKLPSSVLIKLKCYAGASPQGRRWDVIWIREPSLASAQNPGGFCQTNSIAEKLPNEGNVICEVVDKQLSRALTDQRGKKLCGPQTPLNACKQKWCKLHWDEIPSFASIEDCATYVTATGAEDRQNFLKAVCTTTPIVQASGFLGTPDECPNNKACKYCMDDITDYPSQIADNLKPIPTCPDMITLGLNRKSLGTLNDGIEIDYLSADNTWTPVFSLLDSELASCGCGNLTTTNAQLTKPGRYRIIQCAGVSAGPLSNSDVCDFNPGYTTTIQYANLGAGGAGVSTSLRELLDGNQLICNPDLYKNCPPKYKCCGFSRQTQYLGWSKCMGDYHPQYLANYPKCGLKVR